MSDLRPAPNGPFAIANRAADPALRDRCSSYGRGHPVDRHPVDNGQAGRGDR